MSSVLDSSSYGDSKHRDEQYKYTIKWGAIGFFAGAVGVGAPIVYLASRRWPAVQRAHPSVKFSFMLSSACAVGVIAADKAGIHFDRSRWNDVGAAVLARSQTEEERIWNSLTPAQKALTYAKDNRVSAVTGSWVASIALITLYLSTTPMTGGQKLVQARVWGQGLTVASILGLAGLSAIPTPGDEIEKLHKREKQSSWKQTLEMEQPELRALLEPETSKKETQN